MGVVKKYKEEFYFFTTPIAPVTSWNSILVAGTTIYISQLEWKIGPRVSEIYIYLL